MSRGGYPKQFLMLTGDKSLLQQTALRVNAIAGAAAPIVVTNNEQRFIVAEQLREAGTVPSYSNRSAATLRRLSPRQRC